MKTKYWRRTDAGDKASLRNQGASHTGPAEFIPGPRKETHHRGLCGARETALVPPPYLFGQLWVAEVSTQGHRCGHVYHVDRRPVARRGEQIHMVTGALAPHEILGAADHLGQRRRAQHTVKKPICSQASSQEDEQSGFLTEATDILPEPLTFCFPPTSVPKGSRQLIPDVFSEEEGTSSL